MFTEIGKRVIRHFAVFFCEILIYEQDDWFLDDMVENVLIYSQLWLDALQLSLS